MRTIRLELLRHGPPHNQLLSPLTDYLALCENHPAASVQVPFEHAEFILRLKALQYKNGTMETRLEVEDMARPITRMLSSVPGLIRELAEHAGDAAPLFHLRLILSANELALLPFELADAPPGFVGAGHLLLQSEAPVCITREVRRVSPENAAFGNLTAPKILMVASSVVGPVPLEAHVTALRKVIEPWMRFYLPDKDPLCEKERRERVAEHLTVIPQASVRDIETECATGQYTHVHILAHGVPLKKGDDRRYGLALHHPSQSSQMDVVDGARLAKALRPPLGDCGSAGFARPAVVTLAACDAGAVGSVVGAGASIAHALHEDGIPLVVASQFPLSFPGSVLMARELYEGFLIGCDPRALLVKLRRRMRTEAPATHDWASIVAYASFPAGFDAQLRKFRIKQTRRRLEAAFHHADRMLATWEDNQSSSHLPRPPTDKELLAQHTRLNDDRTRLEKLFSETGADSWADGLLASSEKRLAGVLWRMKASKNSVIPNTRKEALESLASSKRYYYRAFQKDRQPWALVQALALTAVLRETVPWDEWELARILSEKELKSGVRQQVAWAKANLTELYLLVPVIAHDNASSPENAREMADKYAEEFKAAADQDRIEVYSTRRQLLRYPGFFSRVNPALRKVADHAKKLAALLPESRTYG